MRAAARLLRASQIQSLSIKQNCSISNKEKRKGVNKQVNVLWGSIYKSDKSGWFVRRRGHEEYNREFTKELPIHDNLLSVRMHRI